MEQKFISDTIINYCIKNSSILPVVSNSILKESKNLENGHMVIGELGGCLIRTLVLLKEPNDILEIGTFTGFTLSILSEYAPKMPQVRITSVEENKIIYEKTKLLFLKEIHQNRITLINQEGISFLEEQTTEYDIIFLDIRKECYYDKIDLLHDKLAKGGLLVIDNALAGLSVFDPKKPWEQQTVEFNMVLSKDNRFATMILPLRDGFTISIKK